MVITLNFYIIVNQIYVYNYSEKNYNMIDNELKNNYIKYIKIIFDMIKINNK